MSTLWTPEGEHPVDRDPPPTPPSASSTPPPAAPPLPQAGESTLSPEDEAALSQQMAAMQEELARTPVAVVVANHAVGLFQLAALHLNQRPPNLEEGRLAIDAMSGLVEGIAGRLGEEEQALKDGLSQLRMAWVALSDRGGEGQG